MISYGKIELSIWMRGGSVMEGSHISFKELFTAETIAEPLASVSADEGEKADYYFNEMNYDVIGFREDREVVGYIQNSKHVNLTQLDQEVIRFNVSDLITGNTALFDCLKLLKKRSYLFVINQSEVRSIITLADVEKPPVRMLFFGVLTFFESNLGDLIEETYPDNTWQQYLTEERNHLAETIYDYLVKENKEINLISSTQLCDKTDVFHNSDQLLNYYLPVSKTKASGFLKDVQDLRNDLAHAQSLGIWFREENVIELVEAVIDLTEKITSR